MKSAIALVALSFASASATAASPNVLLVITDDQGYGDLGFHGNPVIRTPNLDKFAGQSARLTNFYVSPVCSPTRSSLLTGLYNYRTGVVDTFIGRSLMRPDVPTLPEALAKAGYRTGLFGKWHLGDNYPLRPEDRGFQETLWSQGGGLAQPSDPPGGNSYFDPILKKNGQAVKTKGYCTDVFTEGALEFMQAKSEKPFFAYVAYNCPHGPYQVPDSLVAPYKKLDLTAAGFPKIGQPWATPKMSTDEIAKAYGMIENIDANFARMLKVVEQKHPNTVVIFLTDNGPGGVRFNGGLRNRKGTVYEGGIRVPCFVRTPTMVATGHDVDTPLAHIDLTPTILDACGVKSETPFDGRSARTMIENHPGNWTGRTLFFQWHRGDEPEKFRAFAARGPKYKLVQATGVTPGQAPTPKYELFDLSTDPFEQTDLAAKLPDEVASLKRQYETWFADVTKQGFAPPRIIIGNDKENPVRLSRQDWRGPKAGWEKESVGDWAVQFERAGTYKVRLYSNSAFADAELTLDGKVTLVKNPAAGKVVTHELAIPAGKVLVSGRVGSGELTRGVDHLEFELMTAK